MQQEGEPSVEEILDSIKKVIARDNRDGMIAERRERAGPSTSKARSDGASDSIEPSSADEAEEVLELGVDSVIEDDGVHIDDVDPVIDDVDPESDEESAETLIADTTRAAMQENFAALAMLSKPGKQPQIVRSGETSLEGLVREMLRPMLAEWLDANLPGMVEEMVKAEIARIAGKRSE